MSNSETMLTLLPHIFKFNERPKTVDQKPLPPISWTIGGVIEIVDGQFQVHRNPQTVVGKCRNLK